MRCFLLGLAVLICAASPALADAVRASVDSGAVIGTDDGQVSTFKGVPYAAPPVGDLRWRAPAPAVAWTGDRQALDYGSSCSQAEAPAFTLPASKAAMTGEDCLTLNVWTPAKAAGAPVVVWIHGGGNVNGTSGQTFYDGTAFARDGVVLVSINYRLGLLGFFAHPALQTGASGDANFGLLDQIAALKWVQRNIKAFGGDPAKVTVMGESAGGQDVLALMAAPSAKGLFGKAIAESPGGGWQGYPSLASAKVEGQALAAKLGAATAADLRKLPAEALVQATRARDVGPILDGSLLSESPIKAIEAGRAPAIPLLIGSNSGEGSLLPANATLAKAVVPFSASEVETLKGLYGTGDDHALAQAVFRDAYFAGPVAWIAAKRTAATYVYRFDYIAGVLRSRRPDASHGSEVPFVFDTASFARGIDDRQVAALTHGCWVTFIKTGAPACAGAPDWPVYRGATDRVMRLTVPAELTANPAAKPLALLATKQVGGPQ